MIGVSITISGQSPILAHIAEPVVKGLEFQNAISHFTGYTDVEIIKKEEITLDTATYTVIIARVKDTNKLITANYEIN